MYWHLFRHDRTTMNDLKSKRVQNGWCIEVSIFSKIKL